MKARMRSRLVMSFIALLSPACAQDTSEDRVDLYACRDGQWVADTSGNRNWGHDCDPYSSEHFTIFSDGSAPEAKRQLATMAEEVLEELLDGFRVWSPESELGFVGGYTYYVYAVKHLENCLAEGYRNGFFIPAIDCAADLNLFSLDPLRYRHTVKHEMSHTFQFTLTDCPSNAACPTWLGFWFREGQAIYMSGAGEAARVSTLEE